MDLLCSVWYPSAMALIDRVPGDLNLYIGGYVTAPSKLDICYNYLLCDYRLRLISAM